MSQTLAQQPIAAVAEAVRPLPPARIASHALPGGGAVHRFETGAFNWYVIEQAGRLTLVDGGFPGHWGTFRAGLAALGRSVRDIEGIILTHAHADHMGIIERARRASGAPVFVHGADLRAAGRTLRLPWFTLLSNAWHPYVAGMLGHATLNGIFAMPGIEGLRAVEDGQRLDLPGRPVVLHTPGHTAGEISLVLEGAGIVLAGDTLITRSLLRGTQGGPQLAAPGLTHDAAEGLRSLDKLAGLGHATLLTGHGLPWAGEMAEAVAMARAAARQ